MTDRQTLHDGIGRACIALYGKNLAKAFVKHINAKYGLAEVATVAIKPRLKMSKCSVCLYQLSLGSATKQ